MSAAEKLRALPIYGEPWTPAQIINIARSEQIEAVVGVLNSLPQIVAVVKAAEPFSNGSAAFDRADGTYGDGPVFSRLTTDEEWSFTIQDVRGLHAALAALDDALRDVT